MENIWFLWLFCLRNQRIQTKLLTYHYVFNMGWQSMWKVLLSLAFYRLQDWQSWQTSRRNCLIFMTSESTNSIETSNFPLCIKHDFGAILCERCCCLSLTFKMYYLQWILRDLWFSWFLIQRIQSKLLTSSYVFNMVSVSDCVKYYCCSSLVV